MAKTHRKTPRGFSLLRAAASMALPGGCAGCTRRGDGSEICPPGAYPNTQPPNPNYAATASDQVARR